ncbi:MAG: hypothetical protein JWP89_6496 [Schlesneria sp.]|nr:hypothetical protein [Schlesneria sp.]
MPEYADVYAIGGERAERAITGFLDCFLPSRAESADEYEIPQYSNSPTIVYRKASDLIRHCCTNQEEVHAIYWRSNEQPEHAMVFFLADGGVILGISTPAGNSERVDEIASDLERYIGSDNIFITYEDTPPESTQEFYALLNSLDSDPDELARETRVHRRIRGEQSGQPESPITPDFKS